VDVSKDEEEKDELELTPEEIQDLDVPENEGDEVKGGRPPVVGTVTCSGTPECCA
jgi:hypothetical protein